MGTSAYMVSRMPSLSWRVCTVSVERGEFESGREFENGCEDGKMCERFGVLLKKRERDDQGSRS